MTKASDRRGALRKLAIAGVSGLVISGARLPEIRGITSSSINFDDFLDQGNDPASPTVGNTRVYTKSGLLYKKTPDGIVSRFGSAIKSAAYIIFIDAEDSNSFKALNGTTGKIDYGGSANAGGVSGTNASAVINAAIAALTSGGAILVRTGTYNLAASISIAVSNVSLVGENWNTIFHLNNGVNNGAISVTGNNVTIQRLAVDGNYLNQSGYAYGIHCTSVNNCNILDCYVHDSYLEGINLGNGCVGCTVRGCYVYHTNASGIVLYGHSSGTNTHDCVIADCIVEQSGLGVGGVGTGDNIFLSGCDTCTVSNCVCDTANECNVEIQGKGVSLHSATGNVVNNIVCLNATRSILLDGDASYKVTHCVLSGFYIYNPSNAGIAVVNYVEDCEIGNGTIFTTGNDGIVIYNFCQRNNFHDINMNTIPGYGVHITGSTVSYNTFRALQITGAGGTYGAIYAVANTGTNNEVRDCWIFGPTGRGIYFEGCDYTIIDGCTVLNAGGAGIYINNSKFSRISNCQVTASKSAQIQYLTSSIGGIVSNNLIKDTAANQVGISLSGTSYASCVGNYIYNTTQSTCIGVLVYNSASVKFDGNYIYNCATGVKIVNNGCTNTCVQNNSLISCATPVSNSGTSTIQANNVTS